jgi:hypothetical protein
MQPTNARLRQQAMGYRQLARISERCAQTTYEGADILERVTLNGLITPGILTYCQESDAQPQSWLSHAAQLNDMADYLEHLAPPMELVEPEQAIEAPSEGRDLLLLDSTERQWPPQQEAL